MHRYLFLVPVFVFFFAFCAYEKKPQEIVVMTFNIRFDNPSDGINAWPGRLPLVASYLQTEMPDIVGIQESLHHQNLDLLSIMPGYAYVGSGRKDGLEGGEFSPIFFRTDRFKKLDHGQFWLSDTPDVPGSIGWEAVLPRVVAWVHLEDLRTRRDFFIFNTHFSHVSDLARRKSMEFMSEMISNIAKDTPVLVTGDFNINRGSRLYEDMVAYFMKNNRLTNAHYLSKAPVLDTDNTFNGFRDEMQPRVIDYIFADQHFEVHGFAVDVVKDGDIFLSDHWPVRAIVRLNSLPEKTHQQQ